VFEDIDKALEWERRSETTFKVIRAGGRDLTISAATMASVNVGEVS
jgi:hypothetical protein